jgi:hypothetical protein
MMTRLSGIAFDRRHRRDRAGGEDHRAARLDLLATDLEAPLSGQLADAAEQLDVAVLEPRELGGVVEVVDDLVAAGEGGSDVEVARDRLGGAADAAGLGQRLVGPQQPLGRHAGPERALAADEPVLDDRHAQATVGEPPCSHLARRPGTDHHHVERPHRPSCRSTMRGEHRPLGTTRLRRGRIAGAVASRGSRRPRKTPGKP